MMNYNFLPQWSGTSCILITEWTITTSMNLYTGATGTLGWELTGQVGGYKHTGPSMIIGVWIEFSAIAAGAAVAGTTNGNERRCFSTVTTSICDTRCRSSSRPPDIMALVRMLYFCADINVMITHIVCSNNEIADGLTDFQAICFY